MRASLIIPAGLILAGTLLAAYQTQAHSADKTIRLLREKGCRHRLPRRRGAHPMLKALRTGFMSGADE